VARLSCLTSRLRPLGAKLVIERHGKKAARFAACGADKFNDGDHEGEEVWRQILAAIAELQRGRREDEAVN
jgi:hypothetical protein